jgi:hypothetical protein
MFSSRALQIAFLDRRDALFTAGLAASTEERLASFALSAFNVGKIVIGRTSSSPRPLKERQRHRLRLSNGLIIIPCGSL